MQKVNKVSIQKMTWYLAFATTFAFVIPIFFSISGVNEITKTGWIVFIINTIYAVLTGLYAGIHADRFWLLLFFPVVYAIGCDFFFDSHAIYCAVVYLMLAGFAYGTVRD